MTHNKAISIDAVPFEEIERRKCSFCGETIETRFFMFSNKEGTVAICDRCTDGMHARLHQCLTLATYDERKATPQ